MIGLRRFDDSNIAANRIGVLRQFWLRGPRRGFFRNDA